MDLKKQEKIKQALKETLESSSIHAIPNITKNESFLIRFIWIVCFILSSLFCSWFILSSVLDYLNYDVITKIEFKYEHPLIFPVVSFCNMNPLSTEYALKTFSNIANLTKYGHGGRLFIAKSLAFSEKNFNQTKLFGKNIGDFIIRCSFQDDDCTLDRDFEHYYDLNYGNCFRFNSGKMMNGSEKPFRYIYLSGLLDSLVLDLYIGKSSDNTNSFSIENGINLFINNKSIDSLSHEGINISPGYSYKIMLDKYSLTKLPKPYSECVDNLVSVDSYHSDCYKKTFSPTRKYKYFDCFSTCFQKLIAKICECQHIYSNTVYNKTMRKCFIDNVTSGEIINQSDYDCEETAWQEFVSTPTYVKDCDCPVECDQSGYNYKISSSEFPTRSYFDNLKTKSKFRSKFRNASEMTFDNTRQSIARVTIFYDELKQTVIKQEIKTHLSDLISNIGGTLGLFLGFSFLSMIEIVEIILHILLISCNSVNRIKQ